jgi:signal transduction histidine kinase
LALRRDPTPGLLRWLTPPPIAPPTNERASEDDRLRLALERERTRALELEAYAFRLEEARARLEEANVELEGFAFAASHDLGTPLRTVEGYAELLLIGHSEGLDPIGYDLVERLHQTTGRLRRYVHDLLVLSRMRPDPTAVTKVMAIGELVADVVSDLNLGQFGDVVVSGELPVVEVPPTPIRQALQNLIENGIKHNRSPRPTVTVRGETDGGLAVIWVGDNGTGIAERDQATVFDLFARGSDTQAVDGSGAGLTIARRALRALGGELWITSSSERGTVFTLAFPIRFRADLPRIAREPGEI